MRRIQIGLTKTTATPDSPNSSIASEDRDRALIEFCGRTVARLREEYKNNPQEEESSWWNESDVDPDDPDPYDTPFESRSERSHKEQCAAKAAFYDEDDDTNDSAAHNKSSIQQPGNADLLIGNNAAPAKPPPP